jgi:hypothetical protein
LFPGIFELLKGLPLIEAILETGRKCIPLNGKASSAFMTFTGIINAKFGSWYWVKSFFGWIYRSVEWRKQRNRFFVSMACILKGKV